MALARMCRVGPSSTDMWRTRCRAAALEAWYAGTEAVGSELTERPATELVTMMRDGVGTEARAERRGVNLVRRWRWLGRNARLIAKRAAFSLLRAEIHALDVKVHDTVPVLLRVLEERGSPSSPSVGKEYVDVVGRLLYFLDQSLDLRNLVELAGNGNGGCAAALVW